jgi:hypothetical protein
MPESGCHPRETTLTFATERTETLVARSTHAAHPDRREAAPSGYALVCLDEVEPRFSSVPCNGAFTELVGKKARPLLVDCVATGAYAWTKVD